LTHVKLLGETVCIFHELSCFELDRKEVGVGIKYLKQEGHVKYKVSVVFVIDWLIKVTDQFT
jgi:hypothetical protein